MLRAESSMACEGGEGEYSMLAHYWVSAGVARLLELRLPGKASKIELRLGLSELPDPFTILEIAERTSGKSKVLRGLGLPAVTAVLRHCEGSVHKDGTKTMPFMGRVEVASRIVWVPSAREIGRIAVYPDLELNGDSVGTATTMTDPPHWIRPLVSAPVTVREARDANLWRTAQRQGTEVIPAFPSVDNPNAMYALLHPGLDDEPLERIYVVPPERIAGLRQTVAETE